MKLEDEIKQSSFKSEQQKLLINVIYTNNWLSSKYDDYFKNSEITIQQYNVLRILRGQYPKPCSLKLIKERMLDKMSDASRIVDKLKAKHFLTRNECPKDRRIVDILITEKGLKLLKELDYIDENSKKITQFLSQEEITLLNKLLDKLRG